MLPKFLVVKFFAVALLVASSYAEARAALVIFEQAGCAWCETFDREIAPIYGKTEEGACAPLRRVDIARELPADLTFIAVERLTPQFVLIDNGREIGRIRGYPGEDHFWGLLGVLLKRLDNNGTAGERVQAPRKALHTSG